MHDPAAAALTLHLDACIPVPLDMTQQRAVQTKWVLRRQQLSQLSPGLHDAMVSPRHSHVTEVTLWPLRYLSIVRAASAP